MVNSIPINPRVTEQPTFTHVDFNPHKLARVDSPEGRYYVSPSGEHLTSVTTMLSHNKSDSIKQWEARVGIEEANRVKAAATTRGNLLHQLCELYLGNRPVPAFDKQYYWQTIVPYLNNINNIHGLEVTLYSEFLRLAGTADCIGEYRGKMSIIDFKTSSKPKTRNQIENYFMQATAYSIMLEEIYNIKAEQLVIIMAIKDLNQGIVFIENRSTWYRKLAEVWKKYNEEVLGVKNPLDRQTITE